MRHFAFTCPLAQVVWNKLRLVYCLSRAVSRQCVAFSWSSKAQVLGKRFSFKLQTGHAVTLHTLWLAHTSARYDYRPAAIPAVHALFRTLLFKHLETLWASTPASERDLFIQTWSPPLLPSSPPRLVHN
jgi:hypothetical protein